MREDILLEPISRLLGVGPKKEEKYNKLGVYTLKDLLELYPRKYIDYSNYINIADAELGNKSAIKGEILEKLLPFKISGGRTIYEAICESNGERFRVTYFNNRYALMYTKLNETLIFHGKVENQNFGYQMIAPTIISINSKEMIKPIYPQTAGLNTFSIAKDVKTVYNMIKDNLDDEIPEDIRMKYGVSHKRFAIQNIHFPRSLEDYEIAKYRLAFEELLITQIALRKLKIGNKTTTNVIIRKPEIERFVEKLPFKLTEAQKKSIKDCLGDLSFGIVMNRLIQGDVGSGKTVVAAAIAYVMANAGYQSVIMAPTEILANQHLETFKNFLKKFKISTGVLTGRMKAAEKREMLKKIESGKIDVVVGTHALISKNVSFKNLGLVVTDEQHRFGVAQRSVLLEKGRNPHTIVMSATPIPRTLSLILYGDLDISIIDQLPPGRKEIKTFFVRSNMHGRIIKFIKENIDKGFQAYIVCPRVEEGEETDNLKSVVEYGKELIHGSLSGYSVEILHGKLKSEEKEKIMNRFYSKKTQVLVTTTVIEVGIDVKTANIMMVQNAERFGLSQLHQLRGRVGRGEEKSYCILFSDTQNEKTIKRLTLMVNSTDGFKLAEEDLKVRGPGDFFGNRQHGLPTFKIADIINDNILLQKTAEAADMIIKEDEDLLEEKNKKLSVEVKRLYDRFGKIALN